MPTKRLTYKFSSGSRSINARQKTRRAEWRSRIKLNCLARRAANFFSTVSRKESNPVASSQPIGAYLAILSATWNVFVTRFTEPSRTPTTTPLARRPCLPVFAHTYGREDRGRVRACVRACVSQPCRVHERIIATRRRRSYRQYVITGNVDRYEAAM